MLPLLTEITPFPRQMNDLNWQVTFEERSSWLHLNLTKWLKMNVVVAGAMSC